MEIPRKIEVSHRLVADSYYTDFSCLSINDPGKRQKTHSKAEFQPIENPLFEEATALLSATKSVWVLQRLKELHKELLKISMDLARDTHERIKADSLERQIEILLAEHDLNLNLIERDGRS